jgi:hypothetical protein
MDIFERLMVTVVQTAEIFVMRLFTFCLGPVSMKRFSSFLSREKKGNTLSQEESSFAFWSEYRFSEKIYCVNQQKIAK